ncbi:MAG: hypothetical protein ABSD92_09195 [Candidatus Bathyarchaeia archaeon]
MRLTNQVTIIETTRAQWKHEGSIAPIVLTFLGVLAWLIFILLFALFWSRGFSLFQNVIVTVVSFAIVGLLIGLMWVIWGTRRFGSSHVF